MSAPAGMETAAETVAEAEKATAVEGKATSCSATEKSLSKVDRPDDVIRSRTDNRRRLGRARRVVCLYLRKMAPFEMLKRVRDCYVATLGSCAQSYVASYPPYGVGLMSCHPSPLHPSSRGSMRNEDLHGSEFCLSPAFKRSFNESLLALRSSGALLDSDPKAAPFRKSFSDFESCVSPVMKRTYSDAATLYSRSPGNSRAGYCRRSPGWTPNRALGGQTMMIFPIQEAPEVILASFRKEAQELRLASFRKEAVEQELSLRKDGDLLSLTTDTKTPVSNLQGKEVPEAIHETSPSPIAV